MGQRTDPNYGKVGWHCTHASEGCRNCYAERMNMRLGTALPYKPGHEKDIEAFLDEKMLTAPLRWKRPRMVFVCSMTDLFADFVSDDFIDRMLAVMALAPQHTFQVLTKRPERMMAWFNQERAHTAPVECIAELYVSHPALAAKYPFDKDRAIKVGLRGWPLPNVWLGVSCEDQDTADARIPLLLKTPAAVRFLSCEPLLGPIDLTKSPAIALGRRMRPLPPVIERHGSGPHVGPHIDWVIVGGESGPDARPMHPDWARLLRDQCVDAGVSFFFKQWGEWLPEAQTTGAMIRWNDRVALHPWPDEIASARVGKRHTGHLLDGREHHDFPLTHSEGDSK